MCVKSLINLKMETYSRSCFAIVVMPWYNGIDTTGRSALAHSLHNWDFSCMIGCCRGHWQSVQCMSSSWDFFKIEPWVSRVPDRHLTSRLPYEMQDGEPDVWFSCLAGNFQQLRWKIMKMPSLNSFLGVKRLTFSKITRQILRLKMSRADTEPALTTSRSLHRSIVWHRAGWVLSELKLVQFLNKSGVRQNVLLLLLLR